MELDQKEQDIEQSASLLQQSSHDDHGGAAITNKPPRAPWTNLRRGIIAIGVFFLLLLAFQLLPDWLKSRAVRKQSNDSDLRYIFTFGDSFTTTNFDIFGALPAPGNRKIALGNPEYPGKTTTGGPNWLGHVVTQMSDPEPMSYNFAVTGAAVDRNITNNTTTDFDFVALTDLFAEVLGPYSSVVWDARTSVFIVWFGQNDLLLTWETENYAFPIGSTYDNIFATYFAQIDKLYFLGARRFILLNMDKEIQRAPIFDQMNADIHSLVASDTQVWNAELLNRAVMYRGAHPDVNMSVVDVSPAFQKVLDHPNTYGAQDSHCYNMDGQTCVYWDEFHPGQAIHKEVAKLVYNELVHVGFYD